jgi:hypothetical protein
MRGMLFASAVLGLGLTSVLPAAARRPERHAEPLLSRRLAIAAERSGLRRDVLRLALRAQARAAAEGLTARPVLTVIDYGLPSREKRLWVLDVDRGVVLAHELVAHGRNTGDDLAARFSNEPGSLQSSLGTFLTAGTYLGKHGLSLRLRGLEKINDRAESRALVVHGADYVNAGAVGQLGRLGRSQGCPALSRAAAPRIIRLIQGGTILFAYHTSLRSELAAP